jgi:hypothetical protein
LDRVIADDAYATRFDPAARSVYREYTTLKGKEAALEFPAYRQKLLGLAAVFRNSLLSDTQRHEFDLIARDRVQANLDAMARHQAAQIVQWIGQTGDAKARTLSNRIAEERHDFESVAGANGLIGNIKNVYASYGQIMGEDPPVSELKAVEATDKGLCEGILHEAATDPAGAMALYDRYAPFISSDTVRRALATAMRGVERRLRQFKTESQILADSNFTDAVANRAISGPRLQTWRDPNTGLAPSGDMLEAATARDANPVEPGVSDRGVLAGLAGKISNGLMRDRGAINRAYLQNLITSRDFGDLTRLYDSCRDPARSRWLHHARAAFDARFADASGPGGVNANAMLLLPSFLTDLDQAVRDHDLKGTQILQTIERMLSGLDKIYVGQHLAGMGAAPALPGGDKNE